MLTALPHPAGQMRQLAPFALLALLLHIALLFALHLPTNISTSAQTRPLIVSFDASPVAERTRISNNAASAKQHDPVAPDTAADGLASRDTPLSPDSSLHTILKSARSIASDEAKITEQDQAAQERKKLTTPAASLDQYLRLPHKEIRLANGMLKIVTDAGEICFQAVPYFAHDSTGVFGIPSTCP